MLGIFDSGILIEAIGDKNLNNNEQVSEKY